jgi:hypothetical protein
MIGAPKAPFRRKIPERTKEKWPVKCENQGISCGSKLFGEKNHPHFLFRQSGLPLFGGHSTQLLLFEWGLLVQPIPIID